MFRDDINFIKASYIWNISEGSGINRSTVERYLDHLEELVEYTKQIGSISNLQHSILYQNTMSHIQI